MLSIQVDRKYTKDQILEMYLNDVPYGGAAIGVQAASQLYFNKDVKDLDLAQSAFLAGLPQSPSIYSPFTGNKYYIERTQVVLSAMVQGRIYHPKTGGQCSNGSKEYAICAKTALGLKLRILCFMLNSN